MPPTRQPGPEIPRAAQVPLSPSSSRHLAIKCRAVLRNPASPVSEPSPAAPGPPCTSPSGRTAGTSPLCTQPHRPQSHRGQASLAWRRPPGASTPGPTSRFPSRSNHTQQVCTQSRAPSPRRPAPRVTPTPPPLGHDSVLAPQLPRGRPPTPPAFPETQFGPPDVCCDPRRRLSQLRSRRRNCLQLPALRVPEAGAHLPPASRAPAQPPTRSKPSLGATPVTDARQTVTAPRKSRVRGRRQGG